MNAKEKFLADLVEQAIAKGNSIMEKSFAIDEDSRWHLEQSLKILNKILLKKNYSEKGTAILKLSDGIDQIPTQLYNPTQQTVKKLGNYIFKQNS